MGRIENKKGVGRPDEVTPKIENSFELIKKYYRYGLTDKQVCDLIGIGESSLNRYKEKNLQIWETLKNEKLGADVEVIASLYKRATGYDYDELKQDGVMSIDKAGRESLKVKSVTKIKKHIAPDVTAIIYWLRNRQGWKDKIDSGIQELPELPDFAGKTDEELDKIVEDLQKKNGNGK